MERPDFRRNPLSLVPEQAKQGVVLATDVEGPLFLGDYIAEVMATKLRPKTGFVNASPSYGSLMYHETWDWFTQKTVNDRRTLTGYRPKNPSNSQEGTDTIFTLPLLLAEGVTYNDILYLTINSKPTPGSEVLVKTLESQGITIIGITTAPEQPYRELVKKTGLMDPMQIHGSHFPFEETRNLLQVEGVWCTEIEMVQAYLNDCYRIINANSNISSDDAGIRRRTLTVEGRHLLRQRIQRFHEKELEISYDPMERRKRGRPSSTVLGQVIESIEMVGDRAKAAIAMGAKFKGHGNNFVVTMGDGANDAIMLQLAHISIGLNGPDAARAAKIAVVTDNVQNLMPIFEFILKGRREIDEIVEVAQRVVGSKAIICRGGAHTPHFVLEAASKMKKALRGENVTY